MDIKRKLTGDSLKSTSSSKEKSEARNKEEKTAESSLSPNKVNIQNSAAQGGDLQILKPSSAVKIASFMKASSSADIGCILYIYIYICIYYINIYIYIVEFNKRKSKEKEEEERSIGGNLLLEAAKLKSTPSASNILVASRFRPLNEVEQVFPIYIYIRNYWIIT